MYFCVRLPRTSRDVETSSPRVHRKAKNTIKEETGPTCTLNYSLERRILTHIKVLAEAHLVWRVEFWNFGEREDETGSYKNTSY